MIRVGIVGLGFMGKMHFRCYKALDEVKLSAVCDIDESKFAGAGKKVGNINGAEEALDFTGIALYSDFDKMLAKADLDAVSITLPTFLHKDFTIKALEAGLNVLCEKPMAINKQQCDEMSAASKKAGKILQVGHCIRFWPEYVKAKEIIDSGKYGKVKAATFQRLSLAPTWAWQNWIIAEEKSGGAVLDLHIHDTDYVQYVFGMPKAVFTRGVKGASGSFDHVVTQYFYDGDIAVTAEGGWMMTASFGFEMSFNIILEKATIVFDCTRDTAFKLCIEGEEKPIVPDMLAGDGYSREIAHFTKLIAGETIPQVLTTEESRDSVKLIEAERQSAQTGKVVEVR